MTLDDRFAFRHPRVYISNYFESLENQIDLAAEQELIETTDKNQLDEINSKRHEMIVEVKTYFNIVIDRVQNDIETTEMFKKALESSDCEDIESKLGKILFENDCMFFLEKSIVRRSFGMLIIVKDEFIAPRGVNYLRKILDNPTENIVLNFSKDHALAFCVREVIQSCTSSIIEISLNIRLRKKLEFYKHDEANLADEQNMWRKFKIGSFLTGVFDGFSNLEELDLSNQAISQLDVNILSKMTKLKKISLCGNLLENIDPKIFEGLSKMESINLGLNCLQNLDTCIFQNMPNLSMLILSHNQINQETTKNLLNNLTKLKAISLTNNNFTELNDFLFKNLVSLKIIDLNTNRLKNINADAFACTHYLEILDLASNELDTLDPSIFKNFVNLKLLNLKRNKLERLDKNLFSRLSTIEVIDLSENKLEVLEPGQFKGLCALKLIYLYSNRLKSIHPDLFFDAILLEKVDLSRNPLEAFDQEKLNGISKQVQVLYV